MGSFSGADTLPGVFACPGAATALPVVHCVHVHCCASCGWAQSAAQADTLSCCCMFLHAASQEHYTLAVFNYACCSCAGNSYVTGFSGTMRCTGFTAFRVCLCRCS